MKISVVVLSRNIEHYIMDAINSIKAQSRQPDEIICCDDASSDSTRILIQRHLPHAQLVKHSENIGALRNGLSGLLSATGDIICFMDGDDVWETNKIEAVKAAFSSNPKLAILSHNHVRVDEALLPMRVDDSTHKAVSIALSLPEPERSEVLRANLLNRRGYWLGSAYSIRTSMLDKAKFLNALNTAGDLQDGYLDLILGPYIACNQPDGAVGYTPNTTLYYRVHKKGSAASTTIGGTRVALRRVKRINEITRHCLKSAGASKEVLQSYTSHIYIIDYYHDLYFGGRAVAFRKFFELWPIFSKMDVLSVMKEVVRFLVCFTMGIRGLLFFKGFIGRL